MLAIALGLAAIARSSGLKISDDEVRQAHGEGRFTGAEGLDGFFTQRGLNVWRGRIGGAGLAERSHLLPAVVACRDGGAFLVMGCDVKAGILRVIDPMSPAVRGLTVPLAEFDGRCHPELICARPATGTPSRDRPFDWAWVRHELGRSWTALLGAFALAAVVQALALSPIVFMQVALDKVLGYHATATLHVLTIGALFFLTLSGFAGWTRDRLVAAALKRVEARLGLDLFDKLLEAPLRGGEPRAREGAIKSVGFLRAYLWRVGQAAMDGVGVVLFGAALFAYSPFMGAIAATALTVVFVVIHLLKRREIASALDATRAEAPRVKLMEETAGQLDAVKSLAQEDEQRRRWRGVEGGCITARDLRDLDQSRAVNAQAAMSQMLTIIIVFAGLELVFSELMSAGAIVASSMLVGRMVAPIARAAQLLAERPACARAMRQIAAVWNGVDERSAAGERRHIRGAYTLTGVTLEFPGGRRALDGLNLTIPAGHMVGVTGPTGSGKSALLGLLGGLHRPSSGKLRVDGVPIGHLDPPFYRRQVGWLPANPAFFHGTVLENIRRVAPTAPLAEIDRAVEMAGFDAILDDLPDGLDTPLATQPGDPGVALSSSARQLLALARALAADARVLLIDEGFNALDLVALGALRGRLATLAAGRTVVIATHEPGLLAACSRVVLLNRGRAIADGPHGPLLAHSPDYQRLWRAAEILRAPPPPDSEGPRSEEGAAP